MSSEEKGKVCRLLLKQGFKSYSSPPGHWPNYSLNNHWRSSSLCAPSLCILPPSAEILGFQQLQLPYSAHIKTIFQCRCQSMAGEKKAPSSRSIPAAGLPSASEDSHLPCLLRLTFQWNSWCCSFCTKGKWKYKAFLHCVPRPATSLSPQRVPALDHEPYCHASTILISSDFFLSSELNFNQRLFPTH